MRFDNDTQNYLQSYSDFQNENKIEENRRNFFLSDSHYVQEMSSALDSLENPDPVDVINCLENYLTGKDKVVSDLIKDCLSHASNDIYFFPDAILAQGDIGSALILLTHPHARVDVCVVDINLLAKHKTTPKDSASVTFDGGQALYKFIKADNLKVALWGCTRFDENFDPLKPVKCVKEGVKNINSGDVIRIDGQSQSMVFEGASSSFVYIQVTPTIVSAPLALEFDAFSHELSAVQSASMKSSRIESITGLLALMGDDNDCKILKPYLKHPDHFIRWHIMKCLLEKGADDEVILELKNMSTNDPNPQLRRVSSQTLELLYSEILESSNA